MGLRNQLPNPLDDHGRQTQVNNFSHVHVDFIWQRCSALSAADYQKYSSFTLSVVQRIDLNRDAAARAGNAGCRRPRTAYCRSDWQAAASAPGIYSEVAKVNLPLMAVGGFQPLFKLTSTVAAGGTAMGLADRIDRDQRRAVVPFS